MGSIEDRCMKSFPEWLSTLGTDVEAVLAALKNERLGDEARRFLLGGVNYLFKALDLVPDGVADIGYLDDALVLRLVARAATDAGLGPIDGATKKHIESLARDRNLVSEFLGEGIFVRLDRYARQLKTGAARGRTVDELTRDQALFEAFAEEAARFVEGYKLPAFTADENSLAKLKAYLDAKLPA